VPEGRQAAPKIFGSIDGEIGDVIVAPQLAREDGAGFGQR
jgi:hypothetical protein